MRIHVVNPNTTATMTQAIAAAARAVVPADVSILATQPDFGPASIEGFYDGAFAVPGLLARISEAERAGEVDAHLIACFDDTGLEAARCIARSPVIGIGEAAFHAASMVGTRFSVVTTLSRSIPVIRDNLTRYGLAARCGRVRASEMPVLSLETDKAQAEARIGREIESALANDGADCIVLGCAGMADLAGRLSQHFRVPVIDGVAAGVVFAIALARLGLKTSKAGGYASPAAKDYVGLFSRFAPQA
ncbi:MAG: aspartate/glutamate racemase family protein [Pseudorhodoplanes sp.]|nr:aspartate/glutamate racemase family protein [Pseudorhodoplanes sp.]